MEFWTAIGAIATFLAAVVAAFAAWQARAAAKQANATARSLGKIERDRRHAELCPRFKISCEAPPTSADDRRLRISLLGPVGLDGLDELTVTIRNDQLHRGEAAISGGATPKQIEQHIWGPYQFTPMTGPDNELSDERGRATTYKRKLPVGEALVFQIQRTQPPPRSEWNQAQWREQIGKTMRLSLTALHHEYEPWTIACEVDVPDDSAIEFIAPSV